MSGRSVGMWTASSLVHEFGNVAAVLSVSDLCCYIRLLNSSVPAPTSLFPLSVPGAGETLVPGSTDTARQRERNHISWDVSAGIPLPGKVQVLGEGCYSDITVTPLMSPALSH